MSSQSAVMKRSTKIVFLLGASVIAPPLLGAHRAADQTVSAVRFDDEPPPLPREFRGVWIATVGNMDWPSKRGLPVEQQKAELIKLFDEAKRMRLNAVIFQVRPGADALYDSPYEPWSEYLMGRMGQRPEPFYDPLKFAIEEAHRRGLELHAWFNPYRARYYTGPNSGPAAPTHISRTHPNLVHRYGPFQWMDPGEATVRQHTIKVITDVVRRYDIDGVHIDDYFYPYQEHDRRGRLIQFPDDRSWNRYRANGGTLSRADWRRSNVDTLVRSLYAAIRAEKPWVKFGISPFGIWRPGHPEPVRGLDAYTELFADSRKWLREGWLDYFAPQLYWRIDAPQQSYPTLLKWWAGQNVHHRHIWPGNAAHRILADKQRWTAAEILEQIALTRENPGASGNIYFSMNSLLRNRGGIADSLATSAYAYDALVPATPWLDNTPPAEPRVRIDARSARPHIIIEPAGTEQPFLYGVRLRIAGEWYAEVVSSVNTSYPLEHSGRKADAVAVSAIDRSGNESPLVRLPLPASGN